MNLLILNLVLALVWVLVTGTGTAINFVLGYAVGFGAIVLLRRQWADQRFISDFGRAWRLLIGFVVALTRSNLQVAWTILRGCRHVRPGIVAVPLDLRREEAIALYANMITLTPGTFTLEVSQDGDRIFVHALDAEQPDAVRAELKHAFERPVRELLP